MSLSQVLKTFSNSTESLKYTYSGEEKDTVKYLLKKSPEYRDTINELYLNRNKSYISNLNVAKEAMGEIHIFNTILIQDLINRSRKINSLKTMRASGASLEQLSNVALLYALEDTNSFMHKVKLKIYHGFARLIKLLKNIVAAIVKFFRSFGIDKYYNLAKKIAKEEPDRMVKGFKIEKDTIADFATYIKKDAINTSTILSSLCLKLLKIVVNDLERYKGADEKDAFKGIYSDDLAATIDQMKEKVTDINIQPKEMKASEFFVEKEGLYLVSKSFQADMKQIEDTAKSLAKRFEQLVEKGKKMAEKEGSSDSTKGTGEEQMRNAYLIVSKYSDALFTFSKKMLEMSQATIKSISPSSEESK